MRGHLLLAAIVAGGLALTGCGSSSTAGSPTGQPVSTTATTPAPTTTTTASSKATRPPSSTKPGPGNVIGPTGYGKVKLGMSYADVAAAGAVFEKENPSPGCNQYEMVTGGRPDGYVHISKERGVEAIGPILRVSTPEGISVGATLAKVRAAYPAVEEEVVKELQRGYTPVPGNDKAVYRIAFHDGAVETISLQYEDQACYE